MKILQFEFPEVASRTDWFYIYPLGDVHIGAHNCAENQFRRIVNAIKSEPRAYWIGGGDYLDSIILQDSQRFDPGVLPAWMLTGGSDKIRKKIKDMVAAQQERFLDIVSPIKDKCMGLIEGNHEYAIMKHHNRNLMGELCKHLGAQELTDTAFLRLRFTRNGRSGKNSVTMLRMFVAHGDGGGRSPGSEPGHLTRLALDKDAEIVIRGHSHTFHILPPITRLTIPKGGKLGEEADAINMRVANWGCYLRTYAAGPSTYDSRANYPVRPMSTFRIKVVPFREVRDHVRPHVTIEEIEMV